MIRHTNGFSWNFQREWESAIVMAQVDSSSRDVGMRNQHLEEMLKVSDKLFEFLANEAKAEEEARKCDTEKDKDENPIKTPVPDPIMLTLTEQLVGYLSSIFIASDPLIEVPHLPDALHITSAIANAIRRDSNRHGWRVELVKAFQNAVRYNYAPMETLGTATGAVKVAAHCPFNAFYDTSVPIDKVPEEGAYCGYIKVRSLPQIVRILSAVEPQFLSSVGERLLKSPEDALQFQGCSYGYSYNDPDTYNSGSNVGISSTPQGQVDWNADYNNESTVERVHRLSSAANQNFEETVIYRRIPGSWLGIPSSKQVTTPEANSNDDGAWPIYRIRILSGIALLSVEPVRHVRGKLPMTFGQTYIDTTMDVPFSFAARLAPAQRYAKTLSTARIAAMRDNLDKTKIVNTKYIEESTLGDKIIKMKASSSIGDNGQPIPPRSAYDEISGGNNSLVMAQLIGNLTDPSSFAEKISGANALIQGGHVPGNRGPTESRVMVAGTELRFKLIAWVVQATLMEPMQQGIMAQYGAQPTRLQYFDKDSNELRGLTDDEFRKAADQLELADGLLPDDTNVSPEMIQALMANVAQTPQLTQEFDMRSLFIMMANAAGFKKADRIPRPQAAAQAPVADPAAAADQTAT